MSTREQKQFVKRARSHRLSRREAQIAGLIACGEKNLSIAGRLTISAHTVDAHVRRIFHKLGVHTRVEAMILLSREHVRRERVARQHVTTGKAGSE
jgi:DNA-binding NarL/FixJ family response regulator